MADQTYHTPQNPGFLAGIAFGPRLCGLLAFLLGQWIATEFAAYHFLNQGVTIPDIHLFLFGLPLYAPWRWPFWEVHYWRYLFYGPAPFRLALSWPPAIGIMSLILSPIVPNILFKLKLRKLAANQDEIHGSSHWATFEEREEAGLHDATAGGILIGAVRNEEKRTLTYLYDNSDRHILICAPTGTGKSASVAIPIGLTYPHSIIKLDLKEELWKHTAGFRQQKLGQQCLRWRPTQREGCSRINPLQFVRMGTDHELADVTLIAEAIVSADESSLDSKHWDTTATNAVAGLLLHECWRARQEGEKPSLRRVGRMLSPTKGTVLDTLENVRKFTHDPAGVHGWKDENGNLTKTHPLVAEKMAAALQRDPKEGLSVLSNAEKCFDIFKDPLVDYATSDSDFQIMDLVDGDSPVSLYLCVPPNQMERLAGVIRMVFLTIMNQLTEEQKRHKHELLVLLDEFPQLGKMKLMKKLPVYIRGYGVRLVIVVQDMGQIRDLYGPNSSIIKNCQTIIGFTPSPTDTETAKTLSEAIGSFTVQHLSYHVSGMPQLSAKGISTNVRNCQDSGHQNNFCCKCFWICYINYSKLLGKTKVVREWSSQKLRFLVGVPPVLTVSP
jgi:type IV secretion system protein VirD4